jgi:hypothetical protein
VDAFVFQTLIFFSTMAETKLSPLTQKETAETKEYDFLNFFASSSLEDHEADHTLQKLPSPSFRGRRCPEL